MTRIAFGADHAGFELKQHLIERLRGQGYEIIDHGTDPLYRDVLRDYSLRASRRGGHTPQLLQEAFAWHLRFEGTGSMLEQQRQPEAVPA